MTVGQDRGLRELMRLAAADCGGLEITGEPIVSESGSLVVTVSLCIGPIQMEAGGLPLREREEFILWIPRDFPFDRPLLRVAHTRFAGFPHVIWGKTICLYQSSLEWNPADGLYGFFDRIGIWLAQAAVNNMDPVDGPLEPPHHDTDFSYPPFVVRADAPCAAGESWMGGALLEKSRNRTELVGWNDLTGSWPDAKDVAFAAILPEALPMEFPSNGRELFQALAIAGMNRQSTIRNLALAALLAPEGEPLYLVVGLPMRRGTDGSPRIHVAVWAMSADRAESLRLTVGKDSDTTEITGLRDELAETLSTIFEESSIKWCQVLDDRPEIVVRRDMGTPLSWISGKSVLLLGCGALGSWAAEILVRSGVKAVHLVDNGTVKPGLLVRQNYTLEDIGSKKSEALAGRLRSVCHGVEIVPHAVEAHAFVTADIGRFSDFDLVLDCTASAIFQMKLERDWHIFAGRTPPVVSIVIDGSARHCLAVVLQRNSAGGIWDGFLCAKRGIAIGGRHSELAKAFYSKRAVEALFQPEPGCSDPTFVGSTADVASFVAGALNSSLVRLQSVSRNVGLAWSAPGSHRGAHGFEEVVFPRFHDIQAGGYKVRIAESVMVQARAWTRKNGRDNTPEDETGGLLWGFWDEAVRAIWIFEASGPPPDSVNSPGYFLCGVEGTADEHQRRSENSFGACGFIGHWHTHPNLPPTQSLKDIRSMATLVSAVGGNQRKSAMLIFGRTGGRSTAGIYIYESLQVRDSVDTVIAESSQIELPVEVV